MVTAYREATSYTDRGVVRLRYRERGQAVEDSAPFTVAIQTPNRATIHAYATTVVCDGKTLFARIRDKTTSNLDGQVLMRAAPRTLSLQDLFADPVLHDALTTGLGRQPVQLELLLADDPLPTLFDEAIRKRLLTPQRLAGRLCDRVEVQAPEGPFTFWIDQDSRVLRRLEYPVQALAPELADAPNVRDPELVADFRDARLNPRLDEARFNFSVPTGAKKVSSFVVPPQSLPSHLFGKCPSKFTLHRPDGGQTSRESLRGSIAVLVWFSDHPACQASLTQLSRVHAAFSHHAEIQFAAVCTEPSETSDDHLESLLRQWQVDVPLTRDLDACGRDVFRIPFAPTLVVLDRAGLVQIFEVGANPRLAEELPLVLDRLLDGQDLSAEILANFEREQSDYARQLATAQDRKTEHAIGLAKPKQRSLPQHLRLESRWKFSKLERPGNLVAVPEQDGPRLFVIDSERAVIELDSAGQLVNRAELPIAPDAVNFLRTAVDADARRRFVAGGLQGNGAYLFDELWNLVLRYPLLEQSHDGLADVQLADLDVDGNLDLVVGFSGASGVHAVSAVGDVSWSRRAMRSTLSLALAPQPDGKWQVLVAGQSGQIQRLDSAGNPTTPTPSLDDSVFYLYRGDFSDGARPAYCGLSYSESGNLLAMGLDHELTAEWSYPLPPGSYTNPIQFVASADLMNAHYWVLAGPDGSVHFVSRDGKFTDQFFTGQTLTGIAAAQVANQSWLFTASATGITAWTVQRK